MTTLQDQLRERVTTRWIHSTGTTPHASGVKPDALCHEAADRLDELEAALRFYAAGDHFIHSDDDWDTVSGEPQNFWCDDAGTATVEDGAVARAALAGAPLEDERIAALEEELASVLSDWNSLVAASGSPTNGGAVGHVAAMVRRISALEAALAERERPTVAIGAKASEWKTLSPQAQALIQQAAQKAVDRWSEQQKLDGAARAATPLVPLGASDLDRAHGGIDERIAALEAALAERDRVIEQARVALERIRHATAPTHDDGGHHEAAHDLSIDALRAIEEVRK